jgi:hypothetical protein
VVDHRVAVREQEEGAPHQSRADRVLVGGQAAAARGRGWVVVAQLEPVVGEVEVAVEGQRRQVDEELGRVAAEDRLQPGRAGPGERQGQRRAAGERGRRRRAPEQETGQRQEATRQRQPLAARVEQRHAGQEQADAEQGQGRAAARAHLT